MLFAQDFVGLNLLSLIRKLLSFGYREAIFYREISSPAFKKQKESYSVFLIVTDFQVPLTQNCQHARVAYFGVAYSATFHR